MLSLELEQAALEQAALFPGGLPYYDEVAVGYNGRRNWCILPAPRYMLRADLVRLLRDELGVTVSVIGQNQGPESIHVEGPLYIAALLIWVKLTNSRFDYEYRLEALKEIVRDAPTTGMDKAIDTVYRCGGRPALFDFLRQFY